VSGSLNFTWDVQNRGPKGNHQAALGELRKAEVNLRQVRQTVATQVIRASNSLRTAGKRMEVAQISLELADQNLAAEQARFEVGRATNFDVLKRLDERDKSASDALNAHVQYLKALVQLQAVNGEILPAYGIPLESIRSWAPPRDGSAAGAHRRAQGGSREAQPGARPGAQRDDPLRPVSTARRSRL
jgi:outer membrane protein TolC